MTPREVFNHYVSRLVEAGKRYTLNFDTTKLPALRVAWDKLRKHVLEFNYLNADFKEVERIAFNYGYFIPNNK